jgi:hypothetical protein
MDTQKKTAVDNLVYQHSNWNTSLIGNPVEQGAEMRNKHIASFTQKMVWMDK